MDTEKFDWRRYITECLESTYYCCLGTVDPKSGTWSNPVYFAYDKDFNFYFISMPHSRHMYNINADDRISVAIYSTNQDTHGDVIGVQLEGKATVLSDEEVSAAHKLYYTRVYPKGDYTQKPQENMGDRAEWKFVKITPSKLNYFDTRFFGEERQEVPL